MPEHDGLGPEGSYYEAKAREEERQRQRAGDGADAPSRRCS